MSSPVTLGRNIRVERSSSSPTALAFRIDTRVTLGESSSGKTVLVASTGGNKPLGTTHASIGLTAFTKDKSGVPPSALADCGSKPQSGGMLNLSYFVEGHDLVIVLDLAICEKEAKQSSSGKSLLLASSCGAKPIGRSGLFVTLNCYSCIDSKSKLDIKGIHALFQPRRISFDFSQPRYLIRLSLKDAGDTAASTKFEDLGETGLKASIFGKLSKRTLTPDVPQEQFSKVENADNLDAKWEPDEVLCLRFDPTQRHGQTKSGNGIVVTTKGYQEIEGARVSILVIASAARGVKRARDEDGGRGEQDDEAKA